MEVIADVRSTERVLPSVVLTIGSFDGIHLGHRQILKRLVAAARANGGTAALMTLRPHPRQYFYPDHAPNILTSQRKKETLLAEAGVDVLFVLPFDAEVAALDREVFLREIVAGHCRAQRLIIGHDFAFGAGARGNYEFLCQCAPELRMAVEQVPALILDGERVSSTLIRECILEGDLTQAEHFLGRKYSILGKVVQGRGMGVKLGFPTANIVPGDCAVPMHGVYAGEAILHGERHLAAINIGIAPTIRHEDIMLEAFLLDFSGNLVGEDLEVVFHRRLRPEKKYGSYGELIAAIAEDVTQVRAHFHGAIC